MTLLFQEDPAVHEDYVLKVNADPAGNIYWDQWAPELHDLNVRFYLTASGSQSPERAQTTFTDGGTLTITFAGNGSGQVHGQGAGQDAFDCTSSCTGPTYTSNGSVTSTATPASDSTFVSWSSNVKCDNKGDCTIRMDQNQTVIVTFSKKTPTKQDQTISFGALGDKT